MSEKYIRESKSNYNKHNSKAKGVNSEDEWNSIQDDYVEDQDEIYEKYLESCKRHGRPPIGPIGYRGLCYRPKIYKPKK